MAAQQGNSPANRLAERLFAGTGAPDPTQSRGIAQGLQSLPVENQQSVGVLTRAEQTREQDRDGESDSQPATGPRWPTR